VPADLTDHVLDVLRTHAGGRQNAIRADVVASILGTTWRRIMKAVEQLRRRGVFVASARTGRPRGLYIPASDAEMHDALGSFRRAALSGIRTYNGLKRARRSALRDAGQRRLFAKQGAPEGDGKHG